MALPAELTYACAGAGRAAKVPEGLCARFGQRLQLAYPATKALAAPAGTQPSIRLDVLRSAPGVLIARIAWANAPPGSPEGTTRADAPLDEAALNDLLDLLIARNPAP